MSCEDAGSHGAYPQLARTEEVGGSNPLTSTPLEWQARASPAFLWRRSTAFWDHFWTTRATIEGQHPAPVGVAEHGIQAVAQLSVVALEQVPAR